MNWIALFVLSLLFVITPHQRGLFFDSDMYIVEGFFGLLFIVYAIWVMMKNQDQDQKFYLVVFLLPFMYLISFFGAETPKGAMDNLFRWLLYAGFFISLLWVQKQDKVSRYLPYVFHFTGLFIVVYALFGLWGWADFKDILLETRLTGFFQYANTFAAVMSAFWLYSLVVLTREKLNWWKSVYFALPLVGYVASILLSESRGAYLILPIAWFIGLCLLSAKKQIVYILYSLFSVIGAFVGYQSVTSQRALENVQSPGLVAIISGSLVVVVIVVVSQLIRNRSLQGTFKVLESKRYFSFVLPGASIVLSVLLFLDLTNQGLVFKQLPAPLQERITDINLETSSVAGRQAFLIDGMEMTREAPLFGLGGEGWKILFTKYQHQPYWSNETHNGYLETILNTGWIGLIVFGLVFLFLFIQIFRRIREEQGMDQQVMTIATLPALLMIFIHSFIDFNFSYGTVWLIVMWLFAMGVTHRPFVKNEESSKAWVGKVALGLVIIFVSVLDIYSWRFLKAESQAAKVGGDIPMDEAVRFVEGAVSSNPYDVNHLIKSADVYRQALNLTQDGKYKNKVIEILERLEEVEPHNPTVLFRISNNYANLGEPEKAVEYMNKAIKLDRFNVDFYDYAVYMKSSFAILYLKEDNADKMKVKEVAQASLKDLASYHAAFDPYRDNPVPDMRRIDLSKKTYFYAGQAHFVLGQYDKALEVMSTITEEDDFELLKQVNALRILIYEKLGNNDEADRLNVIMQGKMPDFANFLGEYRKSLL